MRNGKRIKRKGYTMLSTNLETTLHRALAVAKTNRHEFATLEHLLFALSEDVDAAAVMRGCGVNLEQLRRTLAEFLENDLSSLVVNDLDEAKPTAGFQRVIHRAAIHVQSSGRNQVTGANVLVALFSEKDSHAVFFLQEQDLNRLDVVNYISHGIVKYGDFMRINGTGLTSPTASRGDDNGHQESEDSSEGAGFSARSQAQQPKEKETPADALSLYCQNLNAKAISGKTDILVGREEEVERTIQILCRRSKTTRSMLVKQA
jgi:ATP-dependent Clp protease ATP-binding subunit ClpA